MRSYASLFFLSLALISSGYAQDTVQVYTGWNIIGSVKAGAVPDVLTTVPDSIVMTSFFGYDPGSGYQSTDTLGKGIGYWVKVSADGIIIFEGSPFAGCGVKRVEVDGFNYGTVQIGGQCWFAENLNAGVMVSGATDQTDNAVLEKHCYGDTPANCGVYGGLYQWDETMQYVTTPGAQGICPAGWHIPTQAELQTLSSTVSGDGNALKKAGIGTGGGTGTNTSGFTALFSGIKSNFGGAFVGLGGGASFWNSTQFDATNANSASLDNTSGITSLDLDKAYGFSVRCLED